jgi:site-specific DNA-methyltransferase (adenine-specific)
LTNISASRYKSHVNASNGFHPPEICAEYVCHEGVLIRADCLDLLANMKRDSVDLAFADPPFNLRKDYKVDGFRDQSLNDEQYRGWCRTWLIELVRVLKPGGALFLYHWPKWLMDLGAWMSTIPNLEYKSWIALKMKGGFPIKGRLHPAHYGLLYYIKAPSRSVMATFNVVRSKSPTCRNCGELVRDYGGYKKTYDRFIDSDGSLWVQISDFWEDTRPARQEKSRESHVNELPLQIPERAILIATKPGDIVFDCFAGGGSTLHAAHMTGRKWIGGELGIPTAALRRLRTFVGLEEERQPPAEILNCFNERFRNEVLRINPDSNRPVRNVLPLNRPDAEEKYASKSKVLLTGTHAVKNGTQTEAKTKKSHAKQGTKNGMQPK